MTDEDAWDEMDAWCQKRNESASDRAWKLLASGKGLDDPLYRCLLGQSDAYHMMRSFIHGARSRAGK